MQISRIVVGTDWSGDADAALEKAMSVSARHGAELLIVHVCVVRPPLEDSLAHRALVASLEEECVALARENLADTLTRAKKRGLNARSIVRTGSPDKELVAVANEEDADLLVTGARGGTGSNLFVIGSVSEGVVRRSATNVLVVRSVESTDHLLVATDLTDASKATIPMAAAFADDDDTIELMHVIDWADRAPPFHGAHGSAAPDFKKLWRVAREEAEKEMDRLGADAGGARVEHRVVDGIAVLEILERAKESKPKLLVVGKDAGEPPVHQRVVERVVRRAPCSVLVARRVPGQLH